MPRGGIRQRCETGLAHTVDLDVFAEHRIRAYPQPLFTIQRAIHHHRFQGFAVAGDADDFVQLVFVVAVAAGRQFGSGGRSDMMRSGNELV